jgi:hypothetical protein
MNWIGTLHTPLMGTGPVLIRDAREPEQDAVPRSGRPQSGQSAKFAMNWIISSRYDAIHGKLGRLARLGTTTTGYGMLQPSVQYSHVVVVSLDFHQVSIYKGNVGKCTQLKLCF